MSFISRLEDRVRKVDSLLCVGLDPHLEDLPAPTGAGIMRFCQRLIKATAHVAAAYKPNAAFFEALGPEGYAALGNVIAEIPDGIPVILDAKRGDIASTAEAYARAAFNKLGADAVTTHLFLGLEALTPFIRDPDRGVFMICKTSNPGAADIQELAVQTGGGPVQPLYQVVARIAERLTQHDNIALVVGATDPEALARVRVAAPRLWILAPGVGAQGADLGAALRAGLRGDGMGILVPVSRGISRADDPRRAAEQIAEAINYERRQLGAKTLPPPSAPVGHIEQPFDAGLADDLLQAGCVRFGRFKLKSGLVSPVYLDLRLLAGTPQLLARVASAYIACMRRLKFDRVAALPYAALPIGTAICLQTYWPLIYPRKETKEYGTGAVVEGGFDEGETAVMVDDLATTGGSKLEGAIRLRAVGLKVKDVVVLIDRESGAAEDLAAHGMRLRSVFTLTRLLAHWERSGKVSAEHAEQVRAFLAAPQDGQPA